MISFEESDDSATIRSGSRHYVNQVIAHAHGLAPYCKRRNILGLVLDATLHPARYAEWFSYIENELPQGLPPDISRHLIEQMARRYMRCWFSPQEKMNILRSHYETFDARFPPTVLTCIQKEGILLTELTGKSGQVYKIILRRPATKEGEIGVRFVDTESNRSLAEMRGVFGPGEQGNMVYWVGAIQGSLFQQGREAISAATRDLNGLRPKLAVLHATAALCEWACVDTIYAPPHTNHVSYRWWRPLFTRHKILSDYDGFWQEFTAERTSHGDFRLILPLTRRKAEDVPSKRRKEWMRRYARIDALRESTVGALRALNQF